MSKVWGAISGKGVELVLTLGTGVGSSLFVDGRLVPNVEVGRNQLRQSELDRLGKKLWNNRLVKVINKLEGIFHYDRLYLGGGNAAEVDINRLPSNVTVVSNLNGLSGGIALWRDGRTQVLTCFCFGLYRGVSSQACIALIVLNRP